MKVLLDGKVKPGATIIEGFPGFGLIGPIVTEYLVDHLGTKRVGHFEYEELPATTAIHNGEVVSPMAVHYHAKRNLIIVHTMLAVKGYEWKAADEVAAFAKRVKAKRIVSIEGVNTMAPNETPTLYAFGSKRLLELGAKEMKESIVVGVTAALLLRAKNVECLFAETHSGLPDSKAAAAVVALLDKYLGLDVDPEPLVHKAEEFEQKLKGIMQRAQQANQEADRKSLSYLG